jgi:hypothetical protein
LEFVDGYFPSPLTWKMTDEKEVTGLLHGSKSLQSFFTCFGDQKSAALHLLEDLYFTNTFELVSNTFAEQEELQMRAVYKISKPNMLVKL